MEILQAVNTVLPYLGEHVITRVEGSRHPTVDLIVSAVDRQRKTFLAEGWWFNEATVTLPVESSGKISVPTGTLSIYGVDCKVRLDGETLFDLTNNTEYFTKPIKVKLIKDLEFNRVPHYAAMCITYTAAVEVYTADFGVENTIQVLQQYSSENRRLASQDNLRERDWNSHKKVRNSRNLRYNRYR